MCTLTSPPPIFPTELNVFEGPEGEGIRRPFLQEIAEVTLGESAFKIITLDKNDLLADGAWLLRTGSGKSFLLIVDGKSARISEEGEEEGKKKAPPPPLAGPFRLEDLPRGGRQAAWLHQIAEAVSSSSTLDVKVGSIAEALKDGRFLYVYLNTGSRESFGVGDNFLHVGGKDAKEFLSFFKEFYSLNRLSTQEK